MNDLTLGIGVSFIVAFVVGAGFQYFYFSKKIGSIQNNIGSNSKFDRIKISVMLLLLMAMGVAVVFGKYLAAFIPFACILILVNIRKPKT